MESVLKKVFPIEKYNKITMPELNLDSQTRHKLVLTSF